MSNEKKLSTEFRRKYHIRKLDSEILLDILQKQGYTIVEFSKIENSLEVAQLIDALQLRNQIVVSDCFIYQSAKYRIIFLRDDLNDEEKTILLAHEEGHILNHHLSEDNILGREIVQEYEANEFVHFLLADLTGNNRKRKILYSIVACVLLATIGYSAYSYFTNRNYYTENLYVTDSGEKYHRKNCIYIRDKKDVRRLTKTEYDSGKFVACKVCLPDDQ